ncbi:MAG: carboxypeptidase M32 [Vibrio sp.]
MSAYQDLVTHFKTIANFEHLAAITGWDQASMMPKGGNQARSEAMAQLAMHIHQLTTAPNLSELFDKACGESLNQDEQASLREMKRVWQQACVLPESLVKAKSLAGSQCEHAWRSQRQDNDWQGFAKNWQDVVALSQEEAQIRADGLGISAYDAMLDLYEPGVNTAQVDQIFSPLKAWLPEFIQAVSQKQSQESIYRPQSHYPQAAQKALGLEMMQLLGFDFDHGRLDISSHPFCGGVPTDVRITTRYDESDFEQALMGIIHETGHARYEQGLPNQWAGLPVGQARSMGIHESQSLFCEMQLGRSQAFIEQLSPRLSKHFPQVEGQTFSVDNLAKLYTRVEPGFIRVDADEVTYPAHVILRYEIERDLINQDIRWQDVPELWDSKMQQYLGLSTQGNFKDGCMQDIHWTDGSFGYFPSYTLGAMYAAQFMAAMKKTLDVDGAIRSGDLSPIFAWLKKNIWQQASLHDTNQLVTMATGEALNPEHFKQHLTTRYL